MKKIIPLFLLMAILMSPYYIKVKAESLRDYKEKLSQYEANKEAYKKKQAEAREKAKNYQKDIDNSLDKVEQFGEEIQESKEKIAELEIEISEKEQEIKDLLTFLQITNGENVYLEYVFGATSFTDFIFRTAIVEELSNHNDDLIIEMNDLILENKKLQEELANKIKEEEKAIKEFQRMLASVNLEINDIEEYYDDIDADIASQKEKIKYAESLGCGIDEDISDCIFRAAGSALNISLSNLNIPVRTGVITSEWGYRTDPITGKKNKLHGGIDIGVREGTPVYASQFGVVSQLVKKSSCGGNIVYIQHNIKDEKITTRYLHLLSYNVSIGDVVTPSTIIGYSGGGSTASRNGGYDVCTTGAHLHFEVRKGWSNTVSVNPRNYINFPYRW